MTVVADLEPDVVAPAPGAPGEPPPLADGRAARRRAAAGGSADLGGGTGSSSGARDGRGRRARRADDARSRRLRSLGMSLAILATLSLGFVLTLSVLGSLKEQRDQRTAYDDFRFDLANGTAPVAQTDENGKLLAPGTSVAILEIPALALQQIVSEGTTSGILMSGPGHRRDTVLPGQQGVSVVYGRRAAFGGPFRDLATLRVGDEIKTLTGQAEATYRVVAVRREGDVLPPPAQKGRLVLLTADGRPWLPDGVVAVDADLQGDAQPADAKVITAGSLAEAEQPMQGDPTSWVSLLLWSQALLIAAVAVVFAWARWGRWEAWLLGIPIVLAVAVGTFSQAAQLLPNLL